MSKALNSSQQLDNTDRTTSAVCQMRPLLQHDLTNPGNSLQDSRVGRNYQDSQTQAGTQVRHGHQPGYLHVLSPLPWTIVHSTWTVPPL